MRYAILALALGSCVLTACDSSAQDDTQQTASDILADLQDVMKQGRPTVVTSEDGYAMKAVIGGKPWTASSMLEIDSSNTNFIAGAGDNIQIHFYIDRDFPAPSPGTEQTLGEGHGADLVIGSDLLKASEGSYTITRIDDEAIEGRFHFAAKPFQSDETTEVSEGTFRVLLKPAP